MANVREIAKLAGVSIATVSRVLNNHPAVSDAVRDKVLAVIHDQHYTPPAVDREQLNIAYLMMGDDSLNSYYEIALLEGISRGLAHSSLNLMVLNSTRSPRSGESYAQMFQRLEVCGAILRPSKNTRGLCEQIVEQFAPAVVLGDRLDLQDIACIYSELTSASRMAVEHLIALGHRRIALCLSVVEDTGQAEFLSGYTQALYRAGLDCDNRLILRVPSTRQGGEQVIRRILHSDERPTGLFITDSITAVGAMRESARQGLRVPDDISIVGFDFTDARHAVLPTMSAVCQDAIGMGREACSVLSALISNKAAPTNGPMSAWLEVHDSVGPVPASVRSVERP